MKQVKILLVEDTPTEAYFIEQAIKSVPHLKLTSRAMNGKLALSILRRKKIDLVLLDLFMPIMDGFETLAAIRQFHPETKVLVISSYHSDSLIKQLIHLKANGFSSKSKSCLLPAIAACISGNEAFDKSYIEIATSKNQTENSDYPPFIFTERDYQITKLLSQGFQTEEISEQLNLSPRTIETYIRNLLNKLALKNRVQLVSFAYENGLLP
ncbi:MAG: response regulator [Bacteroidia bacterium]